jgi:hypothetical protein
MLTIVYIDQCVAALDDQHDCQDNRDNLVESIDAVIAAATARSRRLGGGSRDDGGSDDGLPGSMGGIGGSKPIKHNDHVMDR